MAPKILLLHVTADSSLLECERAAPEFIAAANAVFFKAQGLAMLVPLHETVFGLLEGLLDDWRLLNLNSVKWPCKAEVCQVCINLWSLNKQVPWAAEFGKTVSANAQQEEVHATFSTLLLMQEPPSQWSVPCNKGKGKAKAMEDDNDEEEATQKFRKELEDFVVLTTCDCCIANNLADHCWYPTGERPCWCCYRKSKGCLWNGISVRMQKKHPPLSILIVAKHVKLVQAAKAFLKWQGKLSQFFVLEGYKGKGKAKALLGDSEQAGAKQSFKSMDLVDSDSDKEEEERVCVIKKIKHEHVEELTVTRKKKEIIKLDKEVEIVVSKMPVAGPLHQTSKPIVLVPSTPKPVPKPIIALASPVAGPSTAPIVPSSAPKPAAATALSKPMPVKSASPAIKGGFATEVLATQGTMQSEESSNEDGQGNDDSNNGNVAMDIDSAKCPEETQPTALTKTTVTEVKAPAPVLLSKLKRTPFFKLYCTDKHILFLPSGLQISIQFEQN
ncbi:hypothetical protein C0995_008321 [Termitomyces sp. Mi166|nr:hypothetical protein C0995_008321 [Termitomyces sp. Mi166\